MCTLHPPCLPAPSLSPCYHHRSTVLPSKAQPKHSAIDCADVIVITCHWYKEKHKLERVQPEARRKGSERNEEMYKKDLRTAAVVVVMWWLIQIPQLYLCLYLHMLEVRELKSSSGSFRCISCSCPCSDSVTKERRQVKEKVTRW